MPNQENNTHKVLIPTFNSLEIVSVNDIVYLEALENYCRIHLLDKSCLISTYSFGAVLEIVNRLPIFKIHKSFAVHLIYVKRYLKTIDVEMTTGQLLPVARRRKEAFLEELRSWLGSTIYQNR